MNPKLVLSLWRERWGKTADTPTKVPYVHGKLNLWGLELTHASAWLLPGVTLFALLVCILLFAGTLTVRFSLREQIVFAALLVFITLYARRYAGTLVTLFLIGLTFIASTRYLYWRFTETLGHDFNWDFVLGFGLCAAELYLWLLITLNLILTVWPLRRASEPLPSESAEWPTVDIYIPAQGQPHGALRQAAMTALALDWPRKKIKIFILDDAPRDDIKELAESLGTSYLAHPDNADGKTGNINRALPETNGELIAIFGCDQVPDRNFLQLTVGWFVRNAKLGMLQTPRHFLAPAPSERSLEICHAPPVGGSYALIRRAMLIEIGGVALEPVTGNAHTALKLQALGYGHAYIGSSEGANLGGEAQTLSAEHRLRSDTDLFRVDYPLLGQTLVWKQRLSSLQAALQFYYGLVRLIFFTAPLAYLLAGAHIIQTTPELFFAYALPYLIQAHFTKARLHGNHRLTAWADIRETVLAWYMMVRTTMTLLRTELGKFATTSKADKAGTDALFEWQIALPYLIILAVNLTAFAVGIARLLWSGSNEPEIAVLYLFWSACNLMLLAAVLAVAEETRHIRQQTRLRLQMSAMVQLPSGRTVSCMTENFPETALVLKLPTPLVVDAGLVMDISIFCGPREFTFPARVVSQQDGILRVNVEDGAQREYQLFGIAVLSRDQDWPKWLPGRDANRPFPAWASKPFNATSVKALMLAAQLGKLEKWVRFGDWTKKWKKTT